MPALAGLALFDRIAVGKQDREGMLVGRQAHAVAAQHVGPVGEEGDPAEALGLEIGRAHV